jgi:hypothetical protein
MTTSEPCRLEHCYYEKDIMETAQLTREIHDHLVGTLDKPGLVGRVNRLEDGHKLVKRIVGVLGTTVLAAIIALFFRYIHLG